MRRIILPLLLAVLSCAGAPAAPPGEPTATPIAASATPPPSAATPEPRASASAPVADASASAGPTPLPPSIQPLTEEEQHEVDKRCKPILKALETEHAKAVKKAKATQGNVPSPAELFDELMKNPPKMPADDQARCATLLKRGFDSYLQAAAETEATTIIAALTRSLVASWEREDNNGKHAFCGEPPAAVPPNLSQIKDKSYVSSDADWNGTGWTCMRFSLSGQPQRFQYSVKTSPNGFTVFARGYTRDKSRVVEISRSGKLRTDHVTVERPERREYAP